MTNDPASSAPYTVIPLAGDGPFSLSINTKEGEEHSSGPVTASGVDSNVGQRNHPNQRPLPTACPGEGKPTETLRFLRCACGLATMLSLKCDLYHCQTRLQSSKQRTSFYFERHSQKVNFGVPQRLIKKKSPTFLSCG